MPAGTNNQRCSRGALRTGHRPATDACREASRRGGRDRFTATWSVAIAAQTGRAQGSRAPSLRHFSAHGRSAPGAQGLGTIPCRSSSCSVHEEVTGVERVAGGLGIQHQRGAAPDVHVCRALRVLPGAGATGHKGRRRCGFCRWSLPQHRAEIVRSSLTLAVSQ